MYHLNIQGYNQLMIFNHGSHSSGDTTFHVFSRLFAVKNNEIQGQYDFESVFVLNM